MSRNLNNDNLIVRFISNEKGDNFEIKFNYENRSISKFLNVRDIKIIQSVYNRDIGNPDDPIFGYYPYEYQQIKDNADKYEDIPFFDFNVFDVKTYANMLLLRSIYDRISSLEYMSSFCQLLFNETINIKNPITAFNGDNLYKMHVKIVFKNKILFDDYSVFRPSTMQQAIYGITDDERPDINYIGSITSLVPTPDVHIIVSHYRDELAHINDRNDIPANENFFIEYGLPIKISEDDPILNKFIKIVYEYCHVYKTKTVAPLFPSTEFTYPDYYNVYREWVKDFTFYINKNHKHLIPVIPSTNTVFLLVNQEFRQ